MSLGCFWPKGPPGSWVSNKSQGLMSARGNIARRPRTTRHLECLIIKSATPQGRFPTWGTQTTMMTWLAWRKRSSITPSRIQSAFWPLGGPQVKMKYSYKFQQGILMMRSRRMLHLLFRWKMRPLLNLKVRKAFLWASQRITAPSTWRWRTISSLKKLSW